MGRASSDAAAERRYAAVTPCDHCRSACALQGFPEPMRTIAVSVLLFSGCVDPNADLDAFRHRLPQDSTRDSGVDAPDAAACVIEPGGIQGNFLLAISASLAPGKPIEARVDVASPAYDGGTGITFTAQPLAAADRMTPVGQPVSLGPFSIDPNGVLHADIPNLSVSGAANPITPGAAITANITLTGSLCAHRGFHCGTVSGQTTEPLMLDLEGSTFTLTALAEDGGLPLRPRIDCRGTLADPL